MNAMVLAKRTTRWPKSLGATFATCALAALGLSFAGCNAVLGIDEPIEGPPGSTTTGGGTGGTVTGTGSGGSGNTTGGSGNTTGGGASPGSGGTS